MRNENDETRRIAELYEDLRTSDQDARNRINYQRLVADRFDSIESRARKDARDTLLFCENGYLLAIPRRWIRACTKYSFNDLPRVQPTAAQ